MSKSVWLKQKDKGVAAVIGALLLAAIGVSLFASFTLWYIPYNTSNNQQNAYVSESGSFISLAQQVNSQVYPGAVISQSLKMGVEGVPPFSQAQQSQLSFLNNTSQFSGSVSYAFNITVKNITTSGITASPLASLNVTITNTQNVAEPRTYQQELVIDSSNYKNYEAGKLQNIQFAYKNNNTVIPSWLQSGNSNISTNTVYWLKLHSIPKDSSEVISMKFYPKNVSMFDGKSTGEAPGLSPIYGEYDNGPSVFAAYISAQTPLSDFSVAPGLALVTSNTGSPHLSIYGYPNGNHFYGVVYKVALPNVPMNITSYSQPTSSTTTEMGMASLVDASTATSVQNAVSIDSNANKGGNKYVLEIVQAGSQSRTPISHSTVGTNPDNIAYLDYQGASSSLWNGTIEVNQTPVSIYRASDSNPLNGISSVYLGLIGNSNRNFQWGENLFSMAARILPSNYVMPNIAVSSSVQLIKSNPNMLPIKPGTFSINGMLESNISLNDGAQNLFYYADGSALSYQGNHGSILRILPVNYSSSPGSNGSLTFSAVSLTGTPLTLEDYGSQILSLQSIQTSQYSYYVGENLTLHTSGYKPYYVEVQYINLTSFQYTIHGKMASAFNYSIYRAIGNGASSSGGSWTFGSVFSVVYTSGTLTISIPTGQTVSLQSIDAQFNTLSLINI